MYRYYRYTIQYNTINTYIGLHTYKAKNEHADSVIGESIPDCPLVVNRVGKLLSEIFEST